MSSVSSGHLLDIWVFIKISSLLKRPFLFLIEPFLPDLFSKKIILNTNPEKVKPKSRHFPNVA